MSTGSTSIAFLRFLVFFLVLVIALTVATFLWIRNTEDRKVTGALDFLRIKDRNLEIMEQSFQKLYEADNDFWLYTLTYDPAWSQEYSRDINSLMSMLDSLRNGMETDPEELVFVEQASEAILKKEDLSERFIRLKRLADSLLYVSAAMEAVNKGSSPGTTVAIRRYYPDLKAMGMDTLSIITTSEEERVKKGFFRKVREFFTGSEEKTTTREQVTVAREGDVTEQVADTALTIEEVSQVIAGQTNLYYQKQLRLQAAYREKMEEQQKALILTNKSLMGDLKEILELLNLEVHRRNETIHGNAVSAIGRSTLIISYTGMISLGITLVLLVLIAITIGRIIRYHRQLREARLKAEQDAAEKTRFLAYMSHELRTPLTSVIGFAEQLKDTPLNPSQERFVSSIYASSGMLLATVNDVLDLSRLDAGKMKFFPRLFNPASVVEQVLNSLRPMASVKGLDISFVNLAGDKTILSGDEMRLKQVLINLLNNAVKYTEKGEITLTLSIKPCRGRQCLQVEIKDTGIGISAENLGEIFSEFSQVHEQQGKKWIIGTGLGLPICKKIVEQQGGRIWADSEPGKGSVFTFVVPYNLTKKTTSEIPPLSESIDTSVFAGKRILIVDDTEINLVLLEAIFDKWGVKVEKARNGEEALRLVRANPFDLILSDVNMPEVDGIEMTRRIRKDISPEISKIPVIILTANILQDEIGKFQQAGVTDYVMKPFLMIDLYRTIRKNLK